ncbi:G5 domain-containing protein [Actinoplanes sp. LDG1-06]|uniref:G5 domain-containing protein n=1 Tax=Paractinoplanes ovalisporus TaxID=2810368 RepID=A0ABS2ART7_9ACTN|nr:G5 domain-containing protein [Actinoplanes ovalisporus]MBM2622541.1 G5 domain-containing protein [Actinoplanes ovalisporus]
MPRKSWWARLPFGVRMTAGTSALLIAIGGGVAGIAALTRGGSDAPRIVTAVGQAAETGAGTQATAPAAPSAHEIESPQVAAERAGTLPRISDKADRTGPRAPRHQQLPAAQAPPVPPGVQRPPAAQRPQGPKAAAPAGPAAPPAAASAADTPAQPQVSTRTEYEKREVPFQTRFVRDPSLPRGAKKVQAAGVPGEETLRYLVTMTDGQETDRQLMDITVTRQPQHRVIAFGSRHGLYRGGGCEKLCVPLGRKAQCPEPENAIALGGSVTVLDDDIELLNGDALGELPQMHCELEPPDADSRG